MEVGCAVQQSVVEPDQMESRQQLAGFRNETTSAPSRPHVRQDRGQGWLSSGPRNGLDVEKIANCFARSPLGH